MVGPCSSCGPYNQYCGHQPNNTTNNNNNNNANTYYWPIQYETDYMSSSYASASSSSSPPSSVDCTLSLGTPSTRLSNSDTPYHNNNNNNNTSYSDTNAINTTTTKHRNSVSSFCWDLLHPKNSSSGSTPKPSRSSGGSGGGGGGGGGDPLFARRCSNCDTTSTPLWRNGPRGPKSLCNACGIRFKKEERRAAAATTTAAANHHNNTGSGGVVGMMDPHHGYYNGSSWAHQYTQAGPQKMQCYGTTTPNEYRFMEDNDRGSDSGIQFLSWLTHDRPSGLVHEFTR